MNRKRFIIVYNDGQNFVVRSNEQGTVYWHSVVDAHTWLYFHEECKQASVIEVSI